MKSATPIQFLLAAFMLAVVSLAQAGGLTDLQGNPQKLEDHIGKGKWTVAMFWSSDCHVCNAEAHEYVAFHNKHKNGNIRMLGLTLDGMDNVSAAKEFIAEHNVNFPNLIGEPETLASLYYDMTGNFFVGTPTIMVFAPDGKVRAADAGAIPPSLIEEFISNESVASTDN
jgi:peroxiredoxin